MERKSEEEEQKQGKRGRDNPCVNPCYSIAQASSTTTVRSALPRRGPSRTVIRARCRDLYLLSSAGRIIYASSSDTIRHPHCRRLPRGRRAATRAMASLAERISARAAPTSPERAGGVDVGCCVLPPPPVAFGSLRYLWHHLHARRASVVCFVAAAGEWVCGAGGGRSAGALTMCLAWRAAAGRWVHASRTRSLSPRCPTRRP